MLHKVIKPFPFAGDGYTSERLNVGDVRDFGRSADGLVGEGYIEPAVDETVAAETAAVAPEKPTAEAPADNIEKSVEPPRRGRRRN